MVRAATEMLPEVDDSEERFPAGLKVLVVDDDLTCLAILQRMLLKCRYDVTVCSQATKALALIRESKDAFQVIISDVHMPDMDGFKLLELVGLEMDLPVIMMSADDRTNIVMRGIKHGACDYLIKPVRMEELRNIWQHVVRRKRNDNRDVDSGSMDDSDRNKRVEESGYTSSVNDCTDLAGGKLQKKKRQVKEEDDDELDSADLSSSKKPRVVWSVELHQKFVNAVNQLGIDNAVPKRILELMNVPGITRENVASHLQKFRLYLRRLNGVAQHHIVGLPNALAGLGSGMKATPLEGLDFQRLAASGHIPAQTLAALQEELLCQPSSSLLLPSVDPPSLHQDDAIQRTNCGPPIEREIAFGQPGLKHPTTRIPRQVVEPNPPIRDSFSSSWTNTGDLARGQLPISGTNTLLTPMVQRRQHFSPLPAKSSQSACFGFPSDLLNTSQVAENPISVNQNGRMLSHQPSGNFAQSIPFVNMDSVIPPYGPVVRNSLMLPSNLSTTDPLNPSLPTLDRKPQNFSFAPNQNNSKVLPLPSMSFHEGSNPPLLLGEIINSRNQITDSELPQQSKKVRFALGEIVAEGFGNISATAAIDSYQFPGLISSPVSSSHAAFPGSNIQTEAACVLNLPDHPQSQNLKVVDAGTHLSNHFVLGSSTLSAISDMNGSNTFLTDNEDIINSNSFGFYGQL